MNLKRTFIISSAGLWLVAQTPVSAQISLPGDLMAKQKLNVTPPSPEAASLGRYGDIPVSEYTGNVSFSIPIGELKAGQISLPVSLDYNSSGGIRVADIANNAGLGWALSAASVVSRSAQGKPDEMTDGFLDTRATKTQAYLADVLTSPTPGKVDEALLIADGCRDYQPDIFYYKFGPYSGKFFFGWGAGEIINTSDHPLKISYHVTTTAIKEIDTITMMADDGLKYIFAERERSYKTGGGGGSCFPTGNFASAWYLSRIEDQAGNFVNFSYEAYSYRQQILNNQEIGVTQDVSAVTGCAICGPGDGVSLPIGIINGGSPTSNTSSITYYQERLKKISSSLNDSIVFNYNLARLDTESLEAVTNFKSLDNIKTFSKGTVVKQWDLAFDQSTNRNTLRQVTEKDAGSTVGKVYKFEYNGTIPKSYRSYAVDHWGFYNGASTNTSLVPSFSTYYYHPWAAGDRQFDSYAGASRSPSSTNSLAGLLKKVTYPTGGTTEFTYEQHTAGRMGSEEVDSFRIPVIVSRAFVYATVSANESDTTVKETYNFDITGSSVYTRIDLSIYMGDPGTSSVCGGARKPSAALYKVGTTSPIAQVQGNFTEPGTPNTGYIGKTVYMNLAPGSYYVVLKAACSNHIPLSGTYDFDQASCGILGLVDSSEAYSKILPVGGARIKNIKNKDVYSTVVNEKTFSYNIPTDATRSSGVIYAFPQYKTYRTDYSYHSVSGAGNENCILGHGKDIYMGRSPVMLDQTSGSHIGYEWVTVTETGNGKQQLHFTNPALYPDFIDELPPYMPPTTVSFKTGLLLDASTYDQAGSLLKKVQNQYDFISTSTRMEQVFRKNGELDYDHFVMAFGATSPAPVFANTFMERDNYYLNTGYPRMTTSKVEEYLSGGLAMTTTSNTYHATMKQLLKDQSVTNSDGIVTKVSYTYPVDEAAGAVRTALLDRNMVAVPMSTKTFVNSVLKVTEKNTFALFNTSQVLPQKKERAFEANPLETEVSFNKYDAKGNLLSYMTIGGATTTVLWGYNGAYPVAEITHVDTAALTTYLAANPDVQTTFNAPASDAALRTKIQQLRTAFADAMISGYTYKQMVGITSKTDVNNNVTFYEYDTLGRLKTVKDNNSKILNQYTYQIQGAE